MAAPTIDETEFPRDISRGATKGPNFSTLIVAGFTGKEQRVQQWQVARHTFDVAHSLRDLTDFAVVKAFFYARRGRLRGFRFYDWDDHTTTNEAFTVTGTPTAQLTKTYEPAGLNPYVRDIYKVLSSPAATFRKNAAPLGGVSLDVNTGIVTLPVVNSKAITGITQAASAVATVGAAHGFVVNDRVHFSGVAGMTQINGLVGTVTATGASTITVNINSTSFSAYTSGGTAASYTNTTDVFDWTGEFHVPVRFDVDIGNWDLTDVAARGWEGIQLIEVRD